MDEECESAIGQLAISSQFGREAARILKKPFHSQWRIVLYAPVLSPLFFVQIRVALRVNRGRWRAKGHRSQRHPLRYSSTGCLVSLLFPNEEAVVEGELSPARVRRAVSAGTLRFLLRKSARDTEALSVLKLVDVSRRRSAGARDAGSGVQCLPSPSLMQRHAFSSPILRRACVLFQTLSFSLYG